VAENLLTSREGLCSMELVGSWSVFTQLTELKDGTRCRSWLRQCDKTRKVEGLTLDGFIDIFH
jgi:hypothetical protein